MVNFMCQPDWAKRGLKSCLFSGVSMKVTLKEIST